MWKVLFGCFICLVSLFFFFSKSIFYNISASFPWLILFYGIVFSGTQYSWLFWPMMLLCLPFFSLAFYEFFKKRTYYSLQGAIYFKGSQDYQALEQYLRHYCQRHSIKEGTIRLHQGGLISILNETFYSLDDDFFEGLRVYLPSTYFRLNRLLGTMGFLLGIFYLSQSI